MNNKIIDLNKTVYELSIIDKDIPLILEKLGFSEITKPGMLSSVGRVMTIPKGAAAKKIDINKIRQEFIQRGYDIKE